MFLCNIALYSIGLCFHHQSYPELGTVFALALPLLSAVISPLFSSSILGTYRPGEFIFSCPIFLPFHTVHGGACWIPPKKDTPHPRAKEKPQQDSRRGEIMFRIKPHTCERCSEGSNKTLCAPGPRDWARHVFESPAEVRVSSGLLQGQGLWVKLPGHTACCISLLGSYH